MKGEIRLSIKYLFTPQVTQLPLKFLFVRVYHSATQAVHSQTGDIYIFGWRYTYKRHTWLIRFTYVSLIFAIHSSQNQELNYKFKQKISKFVRENLANFYSTKHCMSFTINISLPETHT